MPGLIERVLEDDSRLPEGPARHLERCLDCARVYVELLEDTTHSQVSALQAALTEPGRAPRRLNGLLALWRFAAGLYNLLGDRNGAAYSVSVSGMIRRQQGNLDEAAWNHELALRTAERKGSARIKLLSCADLEYIARRRGDEREARRQFSRAFWLQSGWEKSRAGSVSGSPRYWAYGAYQSCLYGRDYVRYRGHGAGPGLRPMEPVAQPDPPPPGAGDR